MATGLGGHGSVIRVTASNNLAGAAILRGQVVKLIGTGVRTDGIGDPWLICALDAAAQLKAASLGIAQQDMAAGTAAEYGGTGHITVYGLTHIRAGNATMAANDGVIGEVTTGDVIGPCAQADVDAGEGCGILLEPAAAIGDLLLAFVNFIDRPNAGGSTFGGAES